MDLLSYAILMGLASRTSLMNSLSCLENFPSSLRVPLSFMLSCFLRSFRFELDHKRAGESSWTTLTSETSATFDVTGLVPGTRYVFRGRAGTWTTGGVDGKADPQLQVWSRGTCGEGKLKIGAEGESEIGPGCEGPGKEGATGVR